MFVPGMPPLVSPSLIIKREILAVAASEAVRYKTTVKDVVDGFFSGHVRPGLAQQLTWAEAAAGIPPPELMRLVGEYLAAETIEPADLVVILQAYTDTLPTAIQARELVEAAQRLAKRARTYERQVKAAQASHDATVVPDATLTSDAPTSERRRQVKAHMVQRYSGISKAGLR